MNEIREVHLRLHMNRDDHRRAWDILKEMDRNKYESYADFVANAVILLKGSDNMSEAASRQLEQNKIVVEYAEHIASVVEEILARTIPSFLAGCSALGTIMLILPLPFSVLTSVVVLSLCQAKKRQK